MKKYLKTMNEFKGRFVYILIISMIGCLSLVSCGDDKEEEPENPKSIVGVWRWDFENGYELLTFEENGQYSLVEIDYVDGNWSEEGTYYVKDNILTMIPPSGYPNVYTILTLTETKLIFYMGQYDPEEDDWYRVE